MAVAVYIVNTSDATEVCVDGRADKEVAVVNYSFPNAVPVKLVSASISTAVHVKIVHPRFIVSGETLGGSSGGSGGGGGGSSSFVLMEDSGYILLESGDKVLLET